VHPLSRHIRRILFFIVALGLGLCNGWNAQAQARTDVDTVRTWAIIVGSDTLPLVDLPEVVVDARMPARFRRRMEEWSRLRYAVYTTYPYAVEASAIFRNVNAKLASMTDKKQKKAYLAAEEGQLKKEFAPKLEDLSIYQGKILLKLISRQTGSNCYDIIRELRGGFSARFWQTVAFFFDSNLKSDYDIQQDNDIEVIVREIEQNNRIGTYRSYN